MDNHYVFEGAASSEPLYAALFYAGEGFAVLPIVRGTKAPPKGTNGWKSATTDENEIQLWWETDPTFDIAIVPGEAGVVAIDIDGPDGLAAWRSLGQDVDASTLTVQTPGKDGGYHRYYMATEEQMRKLESPRRILESEHLEAIAFGRYVMVPPSTHKDGVYRLLHNVPIAALPDRVYDAIPKPGKTDWNNDGPSYPNPSCTYCPAGAEGCIKDLWEAPSGRRNDHLAKKMLRLLEFPCIVDRYQVYLQSMKATYVALDSSEPAHRREEEFRSTLASVSNRHMRKNGGFGTGACKNALRVHSKAMVLTPDMPKGLIRLSDLQFKEQKMLFKNLIPAAAATMLAGAPGVGKSSFLRWLTRQVTLGSPIVGGDEGKVLWISSEEGYEGVVGPTLAAARVRMDYVFGLDLESEGRGFHLNDEGVMLRHYVQQLNDMEGPPVRLVVIDSLDLFLGNVDAHNSQQVKMGLKGPAEQSAQLEFACVFVEHLNKREQGAVMNRISGSANKRAMVRSVIGWGRHPDTPGLLRLSLLKSNFADIHNEPSEIFEFREGDVDITKADGTVVTEKRGVVAHRSTQKLPYNTIWDDPEGNTI